MEPLRSTSGALVRLASEPQAALATAVSQVALTILPEARHADESDDQGQGPQQTRERMQTAVRRVINIRRLTTAASTASDAYDFHDPMEEEEEEDEEEEKARSKWVARLKVALLSVVDAVSEPLLAAVLNYPLQYIGVLAHIDSLYERKGLEIPERFPGAWSTFRKVGYFGLWHGFAPHVGSLIFSAILKSAPNIASNLVTGHPAKPLVWLPCWTILKINCILPKILIDIAWVRMVFVGGEAYGTPMKALRSVTQEFRNTGLSDVPVWVKFMRGVYGTLPVLIAGRLLPASHPLAERRGFWESVYATPLYLPRLYLMPVCGTPLPDYSFWRQMRLTFRSLGNIPVGLTVGLLPWLPMKFAFARGRKALQAAIFESGEDRLQRKLQHAEDHFEKVRATIDLKSFRRPVPKLMRTTTTKLKIKAAKGLKKKHKSLLEAVEKYTNEQEEPGLQGSVIAVKRSNILESLSAVARTSAVALERGNVRIVFAGEQGMDMGGVFRDYMQQVAESLPKSDLFQTGADAGLLPARQGTDEGSWKEQLFGVGRLLALAIRRNTPLDVYFSRCLYKVLLGEPITASDVARIDSDFYKNRVEAVLQKGGVAAMESILCSKLTFVGVPLGGTEEDELCDGGKDLIVTEENKGRYVSLLAEHFLIGRSRAELAVMVEGFYDIIPKKVLQGVQDLRAIELELLVAGLPMINVEDWKAHTCGTLAEQQHTELRDWFWEVVEAMTAEERARLLSFACGSGRLPSQGFAELKPPFNVNVQGEVDHWPTAHTCVNQLCLPAYGSKSDLDEKLHKVIDVGAGFGFM